MKNKQKKRNRYTALLEAIVFTETVLLLALLICDQIFTA